MKNKFAGLDENSVEESKKKYGTNKLASVEVESFWDKFKGNFEDPIIKILILALIVNVIFFFLGKTEWYESVGIVVAILLATLVATWSEYTNEESFQKLQEEASKIKCKVYRSGKVKEILIDDIVVGDLILLQTGDKIPADGVLIQGNLQLDQSVLNGETKEAQKYTSDKNYKYDKDTTDFLNEYQVFRDTVVVSGEAVLEVKVVGDETFYGKLAKEMQTEERESPLKVKLGNLADGISKFGYIGSVFIAFSFMFKKIVIDNGYNMASIIGYCSDWQNPVNDLVTAIILAIIIVVVAVPEGLPMMIAMVLSLNMKKLLSDNILVRKLIGIETAGSLNILFSDKTGTITKGELEVITFVNGQNESYDKFNKIPTSLKTILALSIIENTNAIFTSSGGNTQIIGGNATERAVLGFLEEEAKSISFKNEKVVDIPFSSDRKFSATQIKGDHNLSLIKGAPEKIISKCKFYYDENADIQKLNDISKLENKIDELASRSIRVIAVATSSENLDEEKELNELTLVGIIGIRDDLRQESKRAILESQEAGIQVVMVTGDRKETAVAIAKEAGLLKSEDDMILTSSELKDLSDDQLKSILPKIKVIARALPTDKSRLVRVSQELDLVVGMTGDGVNDAPALKKADVGFSMGSGTEVAKEAGDIVVLDDNFMSIVKSVLYGRTIYHSIRKFITYQLTVNVGAILIAFMGPFIGVDLPLSMTQMLWVNLVMDTLAALAFGGEPALHRYMKEAPKKRSESIISKYMWSSILTNGCYVAAISIFFLKSSMIRSIFRVGAQGNEEIYFLTGFFAFFIFLNAFNTFNARTESINLFDNIKENRGFLKVVGLIFVVQIIMTYFGGEILRTAGLYGKEWICIVALSVTIIPIDIIRKILTKPLLDEELK
ncbi:MAG: calcium-translocating P-type ATPase, PMCA-type [Tepidibacter sp.]|jgi:calcium-translocating P-type ATPase|uniref:calcium-translocating P-type ATPase, PMCA-type n=1 Tax=Tepidibacter sp. TaxID=2529387 RepID=UPI0025EEA0B2|nr:calcium-translocating P-type ATPase, PMCA-type [Tepidibacter sp.]MCT4508821.1 calcium-translocating P-type ATPase, PMCA-type [Tepidibacter sp.]